MASPSWTPVKRIAIWSGPRNISTALMRSWGSRPDTVVCDEPFYAYYLNATRIPHPGAAEVLAHHETNPEKVIASLLAELPPGKTILYQKQMAHHLLPGIDGKWMKQMRHGFLIRHPADMLTSLLRFLPNPQLVDTGLPQQWALFQRMADETGEEPPILDARDVLENPPGMLRALCSALDVPWMPDMLSWEAGPRATDGVWGKYWYASVIATTGFEPYQSKTDSVPPRLLGLLRECEELYERLFSLRLRALPP